MSKPIDEDTHRWARLGKSREQVQAERAAQQSEEIGRQKELKILECVHV